MTAAVWAAVLLVGGLGSVLRFQVDRTVTARAGGGFPYGTFAVNLSGALVLGILSASALSTEAALIAGTGFIGAYTTFSTWMLETHRLSEERQHLRAVVNIIASVAVGVLVAAVGHWIGEQL